MRISLDLVRAIRTRYLNRIVLSPMDENESIVHNGAEIYFKHVRVRGGSETRTYTISHDDGWRVKVVVSIVDSTTRDVKITRHPDDGDTMTAIDTWLARVG